MISGIGRHFNKEGLHLSIPCSMQGRIQDIGKGGLQLPDLYFRPFYAHRN